MVRPLNSAKTHVRKNLCEDSLLRRRQLCLRMMGPLNSDFLLRRVVLSQSCPAPRYEARCSYSIQTSVRSPPCRGYLSSNTACKDDSRSICSWLLCIGRMQPRSCSSSPSGGPFGSAWKTQLDAFDLSDETQRSSFLA